MSTHEVSRDEVAAALAVREELGERYEPAVVDGLADRIEQVVQARVQAKLSEQATGRANTAKVAGWSLLAGVPLTSFFVENGQADVIPLLVVWGGLAAINVAHALGSWLHRR